MKKNVSVLGIVFLASLLLVGLLLAGCKFPWEKDGNLPVDENLPTEEAAEETDEATPEEKVKEEKSAEEEAAVVFYDEPKKIDYKTLFVGEKFTVLNRYWMGWELEGDEIVFDETDEWMVPKTYEIGSFYGGDYDGQKFYLVQINCNGPCGGTPYYRITVNADGTWTSFTRYSDPWDEWFIESAGNLFDSYDNMIIAQFEYPEIITDEATGTVFEIVENNTNFMMEELQKYKIFESADTVGPVYVDKDRECTIVALPDGTTQEYDMVINFSTGLDNYESYDVQYLGESAGEVFDVTWNDGTKEDGVYSLYGGYAFGRCLTDKSEEYPMDVLEQIGTTGKGDAVYGFKSADHQSLKDFYEMAFPSYMDESGEGAAEKPTYEEFVANHPLFYWKDPYGRLVEFTRSEYQPVAEVAKPVIYLYPEETLVANVRVEPTDGMSISEPSYGRNGWNVVAKPSGELTNLADREIYPYLFWEGLSLDYKIPEEGFVVASRNVEKFLSEKLAVLGLNEAEIADFMEFWYPKFNSAPYYYITFMPQEDFEKIAPLSVTPAPDTVIRVYMDYAPLARPIEVVEPELVTPEREGFTVIEWGGALHRSLK